MLKELIVNYFIEELGEPKDSRKLEEYVDFCTSNTEDETCSEYCELHHILPRSRFPSLIFEKWNIVKLRYDNHVEAHFALVAAYPISEFIYPLNFLNNIDAEKKEQLSIARSDATKANWERLRNNPEKYQAWVDKRKEWHRINNRPGMPYYEEKAISRQEYWDTHPEKKVQVGDSLRRVWEEYTDEEYAAICQSRRDSHTPESRKAISEFMTKRYEDDEFYEKFIETMSSVNSSPEKKEKAGIKIKQNWEDDVYRNNVMEGRRRAFEEKKRKRDAGEYVKPSKMKERWADPEYRQRRKDAKESRRIEREQGNKVEAK